MTPRAVLVAARRLIEREEQWCQGKWRDMQGRRCLGCAIDDACDFDAHLATEVFQRFKSANGVATSDLIGAWNDSHTHAEVLAGLDAAIAACEGREG